MNDIQVEEEKKKDFSLEAVFDVLYLVIFLGLIAYAVFVYLKHGESISNEELVRLSHYYIPAFFFSLVGIMTVRSNKSLVYAFAALVVSFFIVMFFSQAVLPLI